MRAQLVVVTLDNTPGAQWVHSGDPVDLPLSEGLAFLSSVAGDAERHGFKGRFRSIESLPYDAEQYGDYVVEHVTTDADGGRKFVILRVWE